MTEQDKLASAYHEIMTMLEKYKFTNKEAIHLAKEIEVAGLQGIMTQVSCDLIGDKFKESKEINEKSLELTKDIKNNVTELMEDIDTLKK